MAIKYNYPNEEQVIIDDADDFSLTRFADRDTVTKWQGVGSATHVPSGESRAFITDNDTFVILSTIHRAKGLEAERVFILKPDEMPLVWRHQKQWEYKQELNLLISLSRTNGKGNHSDAY